MMQGPQKTKRVNLRDVAATAGVSVATVSRVLNMPDVVRQETRDRVQAAINALNFHPSAAARAINSGRTKIFGAMIPTLENDIFAQTIEAIERRLGDFGYSLVVATTGEDPEIEKRRLKELLDIGVEGFFLSGAEHDPALLALLDARHVPAIALSCYDPTFTYPTIGYDNVLAGKLAMNHLLSAGFRKIAVAHGYVVHNDRMRDRVAGARSDQQGVSQIFLETSVSVAGGAMVVERAFQAAPEIDAFLCTSDVIALGVLFELQRRGVRVPSDVGVIGIHDLPMAQTVSPRLSTVRLPARRMGAKAAEALAIWLDQGLRPEPLCLDTQLIRRETT